MSTELGRHFVADLVAEVDSARGHQVLGRFVLDRLARFAPYDSAIFVPADTVNEMPVFRNKEAFSSLYLEIRKHPARYLPTIEILASRSLAPPTNGAAIDVDCMPFRERDRSPFYADVVRPQKIRWQIVAPPTLRGTRAGIMFLCRHGTSRVFTAAELARVREVMPAIGLASLAIASLAAVRPKAHPLPDDETLLLTSREREVAILVADGLSNVEIATVLGTSRHTVRNQVSRIFARLNVETRLELALLLQRPRKEKPDA